MVIVSGKMMGTSWCPQSSQNSPELELNCPSRLRIPVNTCSVSLVDQRPMGPMSLQGMVHPVLDMSTSCGIPWRFETWRNGETWGWRR